MPNRIPPASALAASLMLAGCVLVPTTVDGYDPDCRVVTHHMALQTVQIAELRNCNSQGCEGVVLVAAGLAAASAVVSGSIVVVGNIVYWAERQTGCAPAPTTRPAAVPVAGAPAQ